MSAWETISPGKKNALWLGSPLLVRVTVTTFKLHKANVARPYLEFGQLAHEVAKDKNARVPGRQPQAPLD